MLIRTDSRVLRGRVRERPRHSSLTGAWSGAYGYAVPARAENVPFNAVLNEADGRLTGSIDEPNTFGGPAAARLFATIAGERAGASVRFVKTYDGTGGQSHSITYAGDVNGALTRIDGIWSVGWLSGPFFMERAVAAGAEEEREAETGA